MIIKENQRVRLTKTLFKESLIRLLKEKKIYDITVKELCENAELNRSTFYNYYNNIYDVFTEVESFFIEQSQKCIDQFLQDKSAIEPLESLINYIKDNREAYKIIIINGNNDHLSSPILKQVLEYLSQTQVEFVSTEISDYYYDYIASGSVAIINKWIDTGSKESVSFIAQLIHKLSLTIIEA